jgi:hypothetical protein
MPYPTPISISDYFYQAFQNADIPPASPGRENFTLVVNAVDGAGDFGHAWEIAKLLREFLVAKGYKLALIIAVEDNPDPKLNAYEYIRGKIYSPDSPFDEVFLGQYKRNTNSNELNYSKQKTHLIDRNEIPTKSKFLDISEQIAGKTAGALFVSFEMPDLQTLFSKMKIHGIYIPSLGMQEYMDDFYGPCEAAMGIPEKNNSLMGIMLPPNIGNKEQPAEQLLYMCQIDDTNFMKNLLRREDVKQISLAECTSFLEAHRICVGYFQNKSMAALYVATMIRVAQQQGITFLEFVLPKKIFDKELVDQIIKALKAENLTIRFHTDRIESDFIYHSLFQSSLFRSSISGCSGDNTFALATNSSMMFPEPNSSFGENFIAKNLLPFLSSPDNASMNKLAIFINKLVVFYNKYERNYSSQAIARESEVFAELLSTSELFDAWKLLSTQLKQSNFAEKLLGIANASLYFSSEDYIQINAILANSQVIRGLIETNKISHFDPAKIHPIITCLFFNKEFQKKIFQIARTVNIARITESLASFLKKTYTESVHESVDQFGRYMSILGEEIYFSSSSWSGSEAESGKYSDFAETPSNFLSPAIVADAHGTESSDEKLQDIEQLLDNIEEGLKDLPSQEISEEDDDDETKSMESFFHNLDKLFKDNEQFISSLNQDVTASTSSHPVNPPDSVSQMIEQHFASSLQPKSSIVGTSQVTSPSQTAMSPPATAPTRKRKFEALQEPETPQSPYLASSDTGTPAPSTPGSPVAFYFKGFRNKYKREFLSGGSFEKKSEDLDKLHEQLKAFNAKIKRRR